MTKTPFALMTLFMLFSIALKAQGYRIGGGLGYGSQINTIGLDFRGDIKFQKQWSITPHFNYFFNKQKGDITAKWNALNVDGHYIFEMDQLWILYPLIGVNFANVSTKINGISYSNSDVGINLGFGSEYNFDRKFTGFGEIKYVFGNADQLVITFGILYKL